MMATDYEAMTYKELAAELEKAHARIEQLENQLKGQEILTEMVRSNEARKHEEAMNRLGSRLRGEYLDYLDAVPMEMSVDLGENMRAQLENVFYILSKAGVPLAK